MEPWQVAGLRSGIAALTLFLLLPAARRGWSRKAWVVGIGYAACLILYVQANKLTTSANTIFLQASAPLYILLLGPWLLKEPIRRSDLVAIVVMGAGMTLFFVGTPPAPTDISPSPLLGNGLALASGVAWALTIVGLRGVGRAVEAPAGEGEPGEAKPPPPEPNALPAVVAGNTIAFLVCLPFALREPLPIESATPWLVVGYLGVFQIGLAYICLTTGVRGVSALETSLLLLLEPVLNPVWAWAVHGEVPGAWAFGGGALILAATVVKVTRR